MRKDRSISTRWRRSFVWIGVVYVLLVLPGLFWPSYLDTAAGVLILAPSIIVYLLHDLGLPGLLEKDGACGWTMCSPTVWGWMVVGLLWIGIAGCIAFGCAALGSRCSFGRQRPLGKD